MAGASAVLASCGRGNDAVKRVDAALRLLPAGASLLAVRVGEERPRFARNVDVVVPAASLVKLLIAVTYADAFAAGSADPYTELEATDSIAKLTPSERQLGSRALSLPAGTWLRLMIVRSSNLASNVLVHHIGFERVNASARMLGLRVTRMHGFFIETPAHVPPRSHTTASEIAKLLLAIHARSNDPEERRRTAYRRIVSDLADVADRRFAKAVVPPNVVTAEKTGEISGFIGSAAIVDPLADDAILLVALVPGTPDVHRGTAYDAVVRRIDDVLRLAYELCTG